MNITELVLEGRSVVQAADGLVGNDIAGQPDDEHVVDGLVEDQLGGYASVRT